MIQTPLFTILYFFYSTQRRTGVTARFENHVWKDKQLD